MLLTLSRFETKHPVVFRCLEYSKSFKFELFSSNFANKTVFAENFAAWISVGMPENLMWQVVMCWA